VNCFLSIGSQPAYIAAGGTDTNVGIDINAKGTGNVRLNVNSTVIATVASTGLTISGTLTTTSTAQFNSATVYAGSVVSTNVPDGGNMTVHAAGSPYFQWYDSIGGTNLKYWRTGNAGGSLITARVNDAYSVATTITSVSDAGLSVTGTLTTSGKATVNAALDVNPAHGLGVYVSPATDANGEASVLRLYGGANQYPNRYVEISCFNNGGSNVNEMVFKVGNVGTIQEAMKISYKGAVTIPGAASEYALRVTGSAAAGQSVLLETLNTTATTAVADVWHYGTTGDNKFLIFYTEGTPTVRGSISYNRAGGVTAYNTTSDYRLKEQIIDLPNALETVSRLKPRQFDWKETGSTTTGFIAHELAEVCPHAVTGEKDATEIKKYEITPAVHATFDEKGKELTAGVEAVMGEREVPMYQGIDTSFLVATLTAAIQELNSKFEEYKSTHP